jgi:hypothetical protein
MVISSIAKKELTARKKLKICSKNKAMFCVLLFFLKKQCRRKIVGLLTKKAFRVRLMLDQKKNI